MDTFLLNAQRIFDVARADGVSDDSEFVLLVRPDGGQQLVMGGASQPGQLGVVYNVRRSSAGVRVIGRDGARRCELEENARPRFRSELLRDQPFYSVSAPLLT